MQRRALLLSPCWLAAAARVRAGSTPAAPVPADRLALAWRDADGADHVGVLQPDWEAGRLVLQARVPLTGRAHGLLAEADGGFLAVAQRPGRWLLRCDAAGAMQQQLDLTQAGETCTLNGHALASADGHWLFTTETDPATGAGWIGVRDTRTLRRVAGFQSHGLDPHQLTLTSRGALLVANGGIARDSLGRKTGPDGMVSSLAQIDPVSGRLQGRWQLADPQLSLRHLAWADGPEPLLGVALQAEHADPARRQEAPALALWDGQTLRVPSHDARAGGYAGDIVAGPGGGFVISAQKEGRCLWWHPGDAASFTTVAELREPCALAAGADGAGVLIGAGRGAARWHTQQAPRLLAWPVPLAPDNHWVQLRSPA